MTSPAIASAVLAAPAPQRTAPRVPLLLVLAVLMLGLWVVTVGHFVHPPAGYSPRLGLEPDVTGFFPSIWPATLQPLELGAFAARTQLLCLGLAACYCLALIVIHTRAPGPWPRAGWIIGGAAVVAHVLLLFAPPFVCSDLFHYAVLGRMVGQAGLNPYVDRISSMTSDPLMPFATWPGSTSHYGASFTWLSALVATLGGDGVFGTALAFKGLMVVCNLATCWMVPRVARALSGDGTLALAVYAWNPVVLLEIAAVGHNDAVMIALSIAGLLLYVSGKPWWAFLALLLSADTKQVTAALGALLAIHFLFTLPSWRARGWRALQLVALAVAVEVSLWWPFWVGHGVFSGSREVLFGPPQQELSAFGPSQQLVAVFLLLVLLAAALATRASVPRIVDMAAILMLAFATAIFPHQYPWYLIPPLALAVVNYRSWPSWLVLVVAIGRSAYLASAYGRPVTEKPHDSGGLSKMDAALLDNGSYSGSPATPHSPPEQVSSRPQANVVSV